MSKRLSDTEVWKKPWFYNLPDRYKLFWFFILSDCDYAGIWTVNFKIAEAYIGKIDQGKIKDFLREQITVLNGGNYWLIKDFIRFQYGYPLNENSPMYKKLNSLLIQRNLSIDTVYSTVPPTVDPTLAQGYTIPYKNKNKNKNKIIEGGVGEDTEIQNPEIEKWFNAIQDNYPKLFKMKQPLQYDQHTKLVEKYGKKEVMRVYERMENWPELTKKRDSANLTARNFLRTDNPNL